MSLRNLSFGAAARALTAVAAIGIVSAPPLVAAQEAQQSAAQLSAAITAAVQQALATETDPERIDDVVADAIANVIDGADPAIAQTALALVQAQVAQLVANHPAVVGNPQAAAAVTAAVSTGISRQQQVVTAALAAGTGAVGGPGGSPGAGAPGAPGGTAPVAAPPAGGGGGGGGGGGVHPSS